MILKILKEKVGTMSMETNCYIVIDNVTKNAMVIDPIKDVSKILKIIKYNEARVDCIVLTHGHADHMAGLLELKNETNAKVCIHHLDADGLNSENKNLASIVGISNPNLTPDVFLKDGDVIFLGELQFKVIHTPGHTEGSICIYSNDILFSGDTMFRKTWGRTDLPTSSFEDIMKSINEKLMLLPDDTIVYPGHGKSTIIRDEKKIYLDLESY